MNDVFDALMAARRCGTGGSSPAPPPPEPVLIEKTVTENGTYSAADDDADGYSAVTVAVPPPAPQDMVLSGIARDSWWWQDYPNGTYLYRANGDSDAGIGNRACLKSGNMIVCPAGYQAQLTCDKPVEVSAEFTNPDGTRDMAAAAAWAAAGNWGAQPRVVSVPDGLAFVRFTPIFRNADDSYITNNEMPTTVYVHFAAET